MKKFITFCLLGCMLLVPIFSQGSSEKSASGEKETKLTVLWFNDGDESDVFLDTINGYLQKNPNIKIDMQIVAYNGYEEKLKMMISGGNPPDLARVTTTNVTNLLSSFEPIDNYVDDINAVKSNFMSTQVAYATNADGKLIAYPTEATANGMLVNLDAWENAGFDVKELSKTWTWDEFEKYAKIVIEKNDKIKYGFALDFTPHRFSTVLYEMGGHFLNADQTAMQFNNQGTIDTINMLKRFQDEGLMPKSVWLGSENPSELFTAGLVASHIGGSWNINTYNKGVSDFRWCAVNSPKGKINSSTPGGKFIACFKDSANKKAAMDLMAAFSNKENNEKYCADTFNLSSRTDTNVQYVSNSDDFKVFQADLMKTPAFTANEWKNTSFSKVSTYTKEQIVQALMGNITAEKAAENVDSKATIYFK